MDPGEPEEQEPAWLLVFCGWLFAATTLAWVEARSRPVEAPEPSPVDLSRSPARELRRLPGIGPSRANAIVRLRRERGEGEFALREVHGIGPRIEERVRRWLAEQGRER